MPNIDHTRPTTVIFGCGYVGTRLARALLADGQPVRACARRADRLQPLADLGAEIWPMDATKVKQFGPALHGLIMPYVVYSIPPPMGMPGGEAVRRATQAALNAGVRSFVYLGSTGLYGNTPDPDWVDEDSSIALGDVDMAARVQDESAVQSASLAGLRTVILRLTAIYGPGRGVRKRLREGTYKLIDDGAHYISRIHVDDVVQAIRAALDKAPQGSLYLVGDDRPTTQREYAEWLCHRLGVPLPASQASLAPGVHRTYLRGRRVHNDKMKRELGVTLRYPSFVEGEQAIEAEERAAKAAEAGAQAEAVPAAVPLEMQSEMQSTSMQSPMQSSVESRAPEGQSAVQSPEMRSAQSVDAGALPRPLNVRHVASLPQDDWRYPGADEPMAPVTDIAQHMGLHRVGIRHVLVPAGRRTSWPHAHSLEEELAYVLEGTPEVWLDGRTFKLAVGDVVAFPPGTGEAHTVINNGPGPARLLVVGERRVAGDRVIYPLHPEREAALPNERRWVDAPRRTIGAHDGLPDARRAGTGK